MFQQFLQKSSRKTAETRLKTLSVPKYVHKKIDRDYQKVQKSFLELTSLRIFHWRQQNHRLKRLPWGICSLTFRLPTAARSLKIEEQISFFYETAWCIITLIANLSELKFNRIVMTSLTCNLSFIYNSNSYVFFYFCSN